eukprot:3891788-Amphidinium_carterae.1
MRQQSDPQGGRSRLHVANGVTTRPTWHKFRITRHCATPKVTSARQQRSVTQDLSCLPTRGTSPP